MKRSRLAILLAAVAVVLAGCGGEEDDAANPVDPNSLTEEVTTAGGKESPYATTGEDDEDEDDAGEGSGDAEAGAAVFASAGCGGCHTLDAAGSSGSVGPDLDDADPDFDEAVEIVTNGRGQMPSFEDELSEKQIRDVAAYVSEAADS